MDKKILTLDKLYSYTICPYIFYNSDKVSLSITEDVVTEMLSRLMMERATGSFSDTSRYTYYVKEMKKKYDASEIDETTFLLFKSMARGMKHRIFREVILINSLGVIDGVYIPIHLVTKHEKNGRDIFHHTQYYYGDAAPTDFELYNDIKIAASVIYVADKYKRTTSEILWRDQRIKLDKKKFNRKNFMKELHSLTACVYNDIIYKRIGKWCNTICPVRGICE